MDRRLTDIADRARAAVILKDAGGYCVYANRREEELRGVRPGELLGKHITELVDADPVLVEREFERFKRERYWVGQYRVHDSTGNQVILRTFNFVHREWDGNSLYASFAYPLAASTPHRDGPAQLQYSTMTAEDLCTAQLCVDGYSDDEIAVLLGTSAESVLQLVAGLIEHAGARSKTEACVRALKSHLLA